MVTCDHCTGLGISPSHHTDSSKMPVYISVICGHYFICDLKKVLVCVLCYQEAKQCLECSFCADMASPGFLAKL